ncbi:MAG: sulfate/molybdate ABC transporter ATP-binding protein [Luteolibacter sp.]
MSIQALNINKTFGTFRALDDVTLEVPDGKLVSLLGPSGSGKTTLLRILAGLDFPDSLEHSRVLFHGEDVTATPAGKRGVGFVFQHYALFKHMTVASNIAFGLNSLPRKNRPSHEEITSRVTELLGLVQLEGLGKRYPSELSGGQRQRVALARALAMKPKVLLLDEPFGALDAKVRKELRRWLRSFHDSIGVTTIFVTHDQEEALELADEVVVMRNARIEQVGPPQSVYDEPRSPFVYEFLGDVNKLRTVNGENRYVRPHEIDVLFAAECDPTTDMLGKVQHLFSAGRVATLTVRLHDGQFVDVELSRKYLNELSLSAGDEVALRVHEKA